MKKPEIIAKSSVKRKQTGDLLRAVYSKNPQKNLVQLLSDWEHCGSRDCPEQSGMYHVGDTVGQTTDTDGFSRKIAETIGPLLPDLPQSVDDLIAKPKPQTTFDRRWRSTQVTNAAVNVLNLARIEAPEILADPLEELVGSRRIHELSESPLIDPDTVKAISSIEIDPMILLRSAVILNQSDRRWESTWLDMLQTGESDIFPSLPKERNLPVSRITRDYAAMGILHMPGVSSGELDPALIEAGKTLSKVEEYINPIDENDKYRPGQAQRDREFRQILIWPLLQKQNFDEGILKKMLVMKEELDWEKWAVDSLEYFATAYSFGSPRLSPLEEIYRQSALSEHLSRRTKELSGEPNSSELMALNLIERELGKGIHSEIPDFYISYGLQQAAYKRSIEEKWFPEQISLIPSSVLS